MFTAKGLSVSSKVVTANAPTNLAITLSATITSGTPQASEFTVTFNGGNIVVSNPQTSGSTITLTLASAPTYGQTIQVTYSGGDGGASDISDGSSILGAFGPSGVTNEVPMVLTSAEVEDYHANKIKVTLSGTIHSSLPAASAFSVNTVGVSVTAVSRSGQILTLALDKAVLKDAVLTVSYTKPGANNLKDLSNGYEVASWSAQAVTNNVVWTVSTTISPNIVARNLASSITFTGVGWTASTSKIMLSTSTTTCAAAGGGSGQTLTGASSSTLTFTLTGAAGTTVSVCFAKDGSNYVNVDSTTITLSVLFSTASVAANKADVVVLTFTSLVGQTAVAGQFAISGTTGLSVSSASVSGGSVELTLNRPVLNTETINVAYSKPGSGNMVKEVSSNYEISSFGAQSVTNNVAWTFSSTLSATTIGKAVSTSMSFTGTGWISSTSKIMLSTGSCAAATGGAGQTISSLTTAATMTFSIDEVAATTVNVCFARDGSYYVSIASTTITIAVPTVSSYGTRDRFAKNEVTTLSITGIGLNTNMRIKWVTGTCASPTLTLAEKPLSSVNAAATGASISALQLTSAVDDAKVCLMVPNANGGSGNFEDSSNTVDVVDVTGIDHTTLGRNVDTKVTATGNQITNNDKLKFVQSSSNCGAADIATGSGGANEQVFQSTSFVMMKLDSSYTNSLLCIKVGGANNGGSTWTSTGQQVTIEPPSITGIDVNRVATTETRTWGFTGIGLNTGIEIRIDSSSGCSGTGIVTDQALANPSADAKTASKSISLTTSTVTGYVCIKIPTSQGGSGSYSSSAGYTVTIVAVSAFNPPIAGKNVAFQSRQTHNTWNGDYLKIVAAGTACSGTALGGGEEYSANTAYSSTAKKHTLTITASSTNAKICLKVNHAGAVYVDTGLTITIQAPTFTVATTSSSYTGTTRVDHAGSSVYIYFRGYGLSSATTISLASDAGCTTDLAGATEQALTAYTYNGDADTTKARVYFSQVNEANPNAYVCAKIPTNNDGSGSAAKIIISSVNIQIDVVGTFRRLLIATSGSGFKVGTAATTPFVVRLQRSTYYTSSAYTETNDLKHGVTSVSASFSQQCTTRACFDHSTNDANQIECSGSYFRRTASLGGTLSLPVSSDSSTADKIKDGVGTFTSLNIDYWGTGCKVTFTVTLQSGAMSGYVSNSYMSVQSSSFDNAGSAVKIAWTNSAVFKSGTWTTGSNEMVCTAGYECDRQPEFAIQDAGGNTITDNKLHGITEIRLEIPDTTGDTTCGGNYNTGRIYRNVRTTIVNGVVTFPKSNNANTASHDTTTGCYQTSTNKLSTGHADYCSSEHATKGIMFNFWGTSINVRATAGRPANLNYHQLSVTLGSGYQIDQLISVRGRATDLTLEFDVNNWVQGYGPTKSNATANIVNYGFKPERGAPFVTVWEKISGQADVRFTDNSCVSGVTVETASILAQHDDSGTRGNGNLVGSWQTYSTTQGHFMFPRISVDKWGLNYKLRFTATIPTNFAAVNGGQLDSPTFNVNLLLFQKNITVAEIDVHDGDYP